MTSLKCRKPNARKDAVITAVLEHPGENTKAIADYMGIYPSQTQAILNEFFAAGTVRYETTAVNRLKGRHWFAI